jgi:hypothetical protein
VHRPAVVDDEAGGEGRPVTAQLPAQVGRRDRQRQPAAAHGRGSQRRVERDVDVRPAGEPVPVVLAPALADQRASASAESGMVQPLGPALAEDALRVDPQGRDRRGGGALELGLGP